MKRILIAEDDREIAELERDYLEMNGFSSDIAPDGQTALELGLGKHYDLILLDIMLPGMDGYELCAALREKGLALNSELIHLGALLHDLAKGEADHAALGGLWLRELGYWQLANVVRQHTEPDSALLKSFIAILVPYAFSIT